LILFESAVVLVDVSNAALCRSFNRFSIRASHFAARSKRSSDRSHRRDQVGNVLVRLSSSRFGSTSTISLRPTGLVENGHHQRIDEHALPVPSSRRSASAAWRELRHANPPCNPPMASVSLLGEFMNSGASIISAAQCLPLVVRTSMQSLICPGCARSNGFGLQRETQSSVSPIIRLYLMPLPV